jgi:multiple sugar transport system ATP-binding protein/alpha-glucoside transport system ATP-binding protein
MRDNERSSARGPDLKNGYAPNDVNEEYMVDVRLEDIRKSFGSLEILHGIDLDLKSGEFIVFVGPSGCGKSTLLRLIAGLDDVSSGTIEIGSRVVNDVEASQRGISMVFQNYALYPHMSVYKNMAFGMKIAGASKAEIDRRVREAAEILRLSDYLQRRPRELSGGQRQRVAIGRAIVRDPKVFLFDEPLSNLDAALRVATRIEIAKLKERMPDTTMIYVTHDQVEAMTLADRIVILRDGRIEQVGTPLELYHRPDNVFVAQFIGSPSMNIIPARLLAKGHDIGAGTAAFVGVRPEALSMTDGSDYLFEGIAEYSEQLGEVTMVYITVADHAQPVAAKLPGNTIVARGECLRLRTAPENLHFFEESGKAIRNASEPELRLSTHS